ncbi:MAG: sulfocyanin-like copper-binding protein [Micromonosporaceae bacterium]
MNRSRLAIAVTAAALAAAGASTAVAFAVGGPPGRNSPVTSSPAADSTSGPGYSYYRSMMGSRYGGGSMMGGSSYGWMMGASGYRWMMGGTAAPGWMRGGSLPAFMMGTSMMGTGHDPGKIMGAAFANAPGPRVSPAQASRLGNQIPAGATVDRAAGRIAFTGPAVRFTVLGSPPGGRDETFRVAGLTNPAITVPAGARVTIQVINADPDTAHGLVITAAGTASSWMPMMTAAPAFGGSAAWFLGNPTSAGMHAATLTFTAASPGHYQYVCPVPGHAAKGMTGSFTVGGTA